MTLRAGVVGSPAKHSLSPLIHGAWLEASGVDGEYGLHDIPADGFEDFLRQAAAEGLRGLNVTLPFKEQALAAARTRSEAAERAGAANLLLFDPSGAIHADNTDGIGLLHALRVQASFDPASKVITVLGAGGAGRGAAAALIAAGAAAVRIVNRTIDKAQALAAELGEPAQAYSWAGGEWALIGCDALINATSLGLAGVGKLDLRIDGLPKHAVVMDMVYRPLETDLLREARRLGHPTADGLEMLIGQAAPSFEAFFGRPPPDVDVRSLCLKALAA